MQYTSRFTRIHTDLLYIPRRKNVRNLFGHFTQRHFLQRTVWFWHKLTLGEVIHSALLGLGPRLVPKALGTIEGRAIEGRAAHPWAPRIPPQQAPRYQVHLIPPLAPSCSFLVRVVFL